MLSLYDPYACDKKGRAICGEPLVITGKLKQNCNEDERNVWN
jgi:hypothetical protein